MSEFNTEGGSTLEELFEMSDRLRMEDSPDFNSPEMRDLLKRFRLDPAAGHIWLDDYRMVLMHAEVFGSLRKELIESVGVEATRGLLTRMGYLAGSRDAAIALAAEEADPSTNAFSVGPALHALEGFVVVKTRPLSDDMRRRYLHSEFEWEGSAEADAHLDAYGLSSEPVCWMEVGYASGYTSTYTGRRVLVREVECRAMGHERCRSVIKPVEDWDNPEADLKYLLAAPARTDSSTKTARYGNASATVKSRRGRGSGAAQAGRKENTIVGASNAFNNILHRINRVAPTRASVLMLGESGVGKSVLAREIHACSPRADKPFVEINCAAIPDTLIEAELFGVERGAFTGAGETRQGRFEVADGGTLFLDEISSLTPIAQGKLLRVLQTGELEHLGSTKTRHVDVRVVAATNEDLRHAIQEKRFREDLFYRLNVFPIVVPPLRERKDDIPVLLDHCLTKFCARHDREIPGITAKALTAIQNYSWPGNIREFENVIERAVILAEPEFALDVTHLLSVSESLAANNLAILPSLEVQPQAGDARRDGGTPPAVNGDSRPHARPSSPSDRTIDTLANDLLDRSDISLLDIEEALLQAALRRTGGNVSKAAALLKISRPKLDYRIKKLTGNR